MALNPNTIKALFGKLAPMADDVARTVVVPNPKAGAVEVARDMRRIIDNVDINAIPVKNAGNVLTKALDVNPTLKPHSLIETNPTIKRSNDNFWRFYEKALPSKRWSDIPDTTTVLGDDVLSEMLTHSSISHTPGSVNVPELPVSELIVNGTQVIPHANTALGKWYRRIKGNPKFTNAYDSPIGPQVEINDWDLPF